MKKNITRGFVYCLSNEAMPGLYKIGYTEYLEKRTMELQKSGVPYPFEIEFAKEVVNPFEKEQKIHEILVKERVSKNREFFKTEITKIKKLFELLDGTWYEKQHININKKIGKYVRKIFGGEIYYGIVYKTRMIENNENVCCVVYEDNDREDMNLNEFNEFEWKARKIPIEIQDKLSKIVNKKNERNHLIKSK